MTLRTGLTTTTPLVATRVAKKSRFRIWYRDVRTIRSFLRPSSRYWTDLDRYYENLYLLTQYIDLYAPLVLNLDAGKLLDRRFVFGPRLFVDKQKWVKGVTELCESYPKG